MEIRTDELEGSTLDWAVLQCELNSGIYTLDNADFSRPLIKNNTVFVPQETGVTPLGISQGHPRYRWSCGCGSFNPSTDWEFGGPIIERENIFVMKNSKNEWVSIIHKGNPQGIVGETPLIAAMRCYVASKLGNVVEIPDEFIN